MSDKKFDLLLDFVNNKMTRPQFDTMVIQLLSQEERAGLSKPVTPYDFLDSMRTWDRLSEVEEHLSKNFSERFSSEVETIDRPTEDEQSCCIPFQNREDEMRAILSSFAPPYFLLDAPAGYGKTTLLKQLKKRFEEEDWLVAHVCVEEKDRLSNLAHSISQELELEPFLEGQDVQGWGADLFAALRRDRFEEITNQSENGVIFLIDLDKRPAIHILEDLLNQFLPAVQEGLRTLEVFSNQHNRFRVVLAGRYLAGQPAVASSAIPLTVLRLTPFDYDVVRESVRAKSPHYDEGVVTKLAAHLIYLTGGHPGCIAKSLQIYENSGRTPDRFIELYAEDIWKNPVRSIVQDVRDNIPSDLREVMDRLSVFRYMDYHLLDQLTTGDPPVIDRFSDGIVLADTLTTTYLLSWRGRFLRDDITRRLLAIRLRKEESAFTIWCRDARDLCAINLQQPETQSPERWAIEYLYQVLQEHAEGIQEPDVRESLRKCFFEEEVPKALDWLVDGRRRRMELRALEQALADDWEFRFTVNYFLREEKYDESPYQRLRKHLVDQQE